MSESEVKDREIREGPENENFDDSDEEISEQDSESDLSDGEDLGTGSHFRPHQDTAKANGMFATIIIVLPSAFKGGQVHLSHAGQKKIIDIAKDSAFTTSFFAWYTDVAHLLPIANGLDFSVCIAKLVFTRSGWADPTDDPSPSMGELDLEDYEVSNVVRDSGGGRLSFGKFKIPEEWLLPREPFDGLLSEVNTV
ncbi:hypothetical protein H1R20_g2698, partial [Candolleomyces eurysporus]